MEDGSTPVRDAGQDASDASDGATDASDAAADAGYVFDGAVPEDAAVIFTDVGLMGEARLVSADVAVLGAFGDDVASFIVPAGYTLYGTTDARFGGDLSAPYVGPVTVEDLGALADRWDAIILRPSAELTAVVYRAVGADPQILPLGYFPSLGGTNDTIDGLKLPDGVAVVGYEHTDRGGAKTGPYVGPLDVGALPNPNQWSSLEIRASTPDDVARGQVSLFVDANYNGNRLVLAQGAYRNLNTIPGVGQFNNAITSVRGRSGIRVFGFEYGDYGGRVYGPYTGDVGTLNPNDDWDSVVVQSTAEPTVTIYLDGNFTTPITYPIIDVSDLRGNANKVDGVSVPEGYFVFAYQYPNFGGNSGLSWVHGAGRSATVHDDWDSFIVRRDTDPLVTLFLGNAFADPRPYPTGSYPDLESINDQIDGAYVPCGVRIRAFQNENYQGTAYTVTGPAELESVPGDSAWSSMIIEYVSCF